MVRLVDMGRRSTTVVRICDVRTHRRQPGQSDTAGGRRAGQRRQRHATRAVRGKRDSTNTRRRCLGARACPQPGHGSISPQGRFNPGDEGSKRRSRPCAPRSTLPRRSGTAWSPADPVRATLDCARVRTFRRSWMDSSAQALPEAVNPLIAGTTVEILTLRPTMSYGLTPAGADKRVH